MMHSETGCIHSGAIFLAIISSLLLAKWDAWLVQGWLSNGCSLSTGIYLRYLRYCSTVVMITLGCLLSPCPSPSLAVTRLLSPPLKGASPPRSPAYLRYSRHRMAPRAYPLPPRTCPMIPVRDLILPLVTGPMSHYSDHIYFRRSALRGSRHSDKADIWETSQFTHLSSLIIPMHFRMPYLESRILIFIAESSNLRIFASSRRHCRQFSRTNALHCRPNLLCYSFPWGFITQR